MKIYYVVTDLTAGSNLVKGAVVYEYLKRANIDIELVLKTPIDAKNSIIVFVGSLGVGHKLTTDIIEILKSNNNKLVVDPVDSLCYIHFDLVRESLLYSFMDGVIFPNKFSESHFMQDLSCKSITIPHHYDTKLDSISIVKMNKFGVCYAGSSYIDTYFQSKPDWLDLNFEGHTDSVLDMLIKYPVHFSHRDSNSIDFYFKPGTKLATASATNSVFVTSRDSAVVDILGEDYPLYIDSNVENTNKLISHLQSEYDKNGLEAYSKLVTDIRKKVDIDEIYIYYIEFFNSL